MEERTRPSKVGAADPFAPEWDAQIRQLPGASAFCGSGWAKVLAETYGFSPFYLKTAGEDGTVSILPIMEVNSWLTGKRGVALPFTDECAPLGPVAAPIIEAACEIGLERDWRHLQFRGEVEKFRGTGPPSLVFWGHKLDLTAGAGQLFAQFESPVRRAIRKAEKSGLQIEFATSAEAVKDFYRLHCLTRKTQGLPPQPFRFFQNIQRHILAPGSGVVVSAKFGGRAVASSVFFFNDSEAIYKFGASDGKFQELRANNLVMWEAIKWFCAKGPSALRFGRTSRKNEGLRRFKLGWGATEYGINYYTYALRKKEVQPERDNEAGWHNHFFRAAPIAVSRWIGTFLYRHVG